jgi:hypothetical protein
MTYDDDTDKPDAGEAQDERSQLELQIAGVEAGIQREKTSSFFRYAFAGGTIAAMGFVALFFGRQIFTTDDEFAKLMRDKLLPVAGVVYGLFIFLYGVVLNKSRLAAKEADLSVLKARQRIADRFARGGSDVSETSYFDSLVRINVENLAAYYALVKAQTDKSFLASLAVGVVGFVLIITGLMIGFVDVKNAQPLSYISSGSGVITEFIAGVFFYLYNKTVQQMKGYHDSLLAVQNVLLSFKLVGDTKDEQVKSKMMGQMLGYLVGDKLGAVLPADNNDK